MNLPLNVMIITKEQYDNMTERIQVVEAFSADYQRYCSLFLMPDVWGKNVYKAVLDDAFKLREDLVRLREKL